MASRNVRFRPIAVIGVLRNSCSVEKNPIRKSRLVPGDISDDFVLLNPKLRLASPAKSTPSEGLRSTPRRDVFLPPIYEQLETIAELVD
jgi:hypothetical protein